LDFAAGPAAEFWARCCLQIKLKERRLIMKNISWNRRDGLDAFHRFCAQNKGRSVVLELMDRSQTVKGTLYNHSLGPMEAGLSLLLTRRVTHPAYYSLERVHSIQAMDAISSIEHVLEDLQLDPFSIEGASVSR
jgi:hypothetical protein